MSRVDVVVETPISKGMRVRQLEGMFDVPQAETSKLAWSFDAPYDAEPWSVGLIVGPSGSGKSTIARSLFGQDFDPAIRWSAPSVIEDFDEKFLMADIAEACSAVGFNTIPAWMRPFAVLSNGEQFRVALARKMLERELAVVDEFTSVVDRQVAKIASHAVQKYVRRRARKFVAVSCHYDIEEWLQPDWVIEPASQTFRRRSVRPRPQLEGEIKRVDHSAWDLFAPYHYLNNELHRSARCYVLTVEGRPAAFAGMLPRPISQGPEKGTAIWGTSRLVTLPDFQGLGLIFTLLDTLSSAYAGNGDRVRAYPAHPSFIRAFDRSPKWRLVHRPAQNITSRRSQLGLGGRPCATFEYEAEARPELVQLIHGE